MPPAAVALFFYLSLNNRIYTFSISAKQIKPQKIKPKKRKEKKNDLTKGRVN